MNDVLSYIFYIFGILLLLLAGFGAISDTANDVVIYEALAGLLFMIWGNLKSIESRIEWLMRK